MSVSSVPRYCFWIEVTDDDDVELTLKSLENIECYYIGVYYAKDDETDYDDHYAGIVHFSSPAHLADLIEATGYCVKNIRKNVYATCNFLRKTKPDKILEWGYLPEEDTYCHEMRDKICLSMEEIREKKELPNGHSRKLVAKEKGLTFPQFAKFG